MLKIPLDSGLFIKTMLIICPRPMVKRRSVLRKVLFSIIFRLSAAPVAVPPLSHPYDSSTNHLVPPYLKIF